MSKRRPFWRRRDSSKDGSKPSREAGERKQKANQGKQKRAVQRIKERLETFASSIIVKYNLRQSTETSMFLRLFLRRKVLEKKKRTRKENDGMLLADNACHLLNIILENRPGGISLKQGQRVYNSIGTIMRIASPLLKNTDIFQEMNAVRKFPKTYFERHILTKESQKHYFDRMQKTAKQNLMKITQNKNERVLINRLRLMETIEIGNVAISELAKDMPKQTQIALDAVEETIERISQAGEY